MRTMQSKLFVLAMTAMLAAVGCDSDTTEKITTVAPQKLVYDNGGCAYDCSWDPNCNSNGGAVVEGQCGPYQYCCQVEDEPPKDQ